MCRKWETEATSQDLHASSVEQQWGGNSVTPKPCSSTKEPVNVQELINFNHQQLFSLAEQRTPAHEPFWWASWKCSGDTKQSSTGPLWNVTCRPASRQTLNRRLAPWGRWGWQTGAWGGRSRRSKCTAGWMTSVTPFFRFPWRQEPTPPTPFLFLPTRAAHTHHARTAW